MKVLLIGANGFLGPHVVRELASHHQLRITDIKPPTDEIRAQYSGHEFMDLDVTDAQQVRRGADGMAAIVNLSVVPRHPE